MKIRVINEGEDNTLDVITSALDKQLREKKLKEVLDSMPRPGAEILFENFDLIADAPNGVQKLRELVLDLAFQGRLVKQDARDNRASQLLQEMRNEKERLIKQKKLKRSEPAPRLEVSEIPYSLPECWLWVRLADITHDWGQKEPDKKFTYIDVSSIDKERGVISKDVKILNAKDAPSRARRLVAEGTVIYSTVRPYLLNTAIVKEKITPEPIVSTAFAVLHPMTGLENRYLHYYLRSKAFTGFVNSEMTGMAYPAISDSKLQLGPVPLAPTNEQRRIVAKVDQLMALCDELEEKQKKRNEARISLNTSALDHLVAAKEPEEFGTHWQRITTNFNRLYDKPETVGKLRQAILQLAVQGKLTADYRAVILSEAKNLNKDLESSFKLSTGEMYEPASVLLEKIKAEKEKLVKEKKIKPSKPLPPITEDEIPYELPKGWVWVRVSDIASHRLGKMLDAAKNQGDMYPYLRNVNVQWMRFNLDDVKEMKFAKEEIAEYELKDGDLLVCEGGEPGRCAIWSGETEPMFFQKAIHRVRPFGGIEPWFLLYNLYADAQSGRLATQFTGATIKHFTGQELARYVFALPPLFEQRRIMKRLKELFNDVYELETKLTHAEQASEELVEAVVRGVVG